MFLAADEEVVTSKHSVIYHIILHLTGFKRE